MLFVPHPTAALSVPEGRTCGRPTGTSGLAHHRATACRFLGDHPACTAAPAVVPPLQRASANDVGGFFQLPPHLLPAGGWVQRGGGGGGGI